MLPRKDADPDAVQTATMEYPLPTGMKCTYNIATDDTEWPAEIQLLLGDYDKYCMRKIPYKDGEVQFTRYIGKVVTSFFPSAGNTEAPGCHDPGGKPLHSRHVLLTYLLKQTVSATGELYVEGVSQDFVDGAGEVGEGSLRILGGDREGDDFYAETNFPQNDLPDGTVVGEIANVEWKLHRTSISDNSILETWPLYADGGLLRDDLDLAASDDGLMLVGKMPLMKAGFPKQTLEMTGV